MNYKKGFTLIELLVVVALIGLGASIILTSIYGSRDRSVDQGRVSNLNEIAKALQLYNTDNGSFPETLDDLTADYYKVDPSELLPYVYAPTGSLNRCTGYHLGVVVSNPELKALDLDADAAPVVGVCAGSGDFDGASTDCGSGVGVELCYDLKQ